MVLPYYSLHLLYGAAIVSAQSNTYTAASPDAYKVTIENKPTPAVDEVLIQPENNGDINIFIGETRRKSIKEAKKGCGDKIDLDCYRKVADAWGYIEKGEPSGISKRVLPALAVGAWVLGAVSVFIGLIVESTGGLDSGGIRIPVEEQDKVKHPFGDSQVFQSDDGEVKIEVPAAPEYAPQEKLVPTITFNKDGSVDMTMTKEDASHVKESLKGVICKRSMRKARSQAISDAMRECIEHASADIARNTDLGAWLQKFQGLRWTINMPGAANEVPLPAAFPDIPQTLQETTDLLSIFGEDAQTTRTSIARVSLLLSWINMGTDVETSEKIHIPAELMQQEDIKDDSDRCKAPSSDGNYFCNQECGGKSSDAGRTPQRLRARKSSVEQPEWTQIWRCKGRDDNDERKG